MRTHQAPWTPHVAPTSAVRMCWLVLMLGVGTVSPSFAATIVQTQTLPLTKTAQAGITPVPPLGSFTFNKFDSQGGALTLTGATLTFQGEMYNDGNFEFISPNTQIDVSLNTSDVVLQQLPGNRTFTAPVAISYTKSALTTPTAIVSPGSPITVPIAPTDNVAFAPNASNTNPFLFTSSSDLAFFTGSGTFSLPLFASALSDFTSSTGNGDVVLNTLAGGNVTITYIYTRKQIPTPEPATGLMLGLGGLALVVMTRRGRGR